MKKFAIACALLLTGCASSEGAITIDDHLKNPLFAEVFYDELTNYMVSLDIQNDVIMKDRGSIVDDIRKEALAKAKDANRIQADGLIGSFSASRQLATGEVLLLDDALYIGPEFTTIPGPSLHIFLSTLASGEDERFPEESDSDLGLLKNTYGASSYAIPAPPKGQEWKSVVLWDSTLRIVYGSAALAPM